MESVKGKGATFSIHIPNSLLNPQSLKERNSVALEGLKTTPDFTLLVAEDEEVNYLYIETIVEGISDYSIRIIQARDGQEAVDICRNNNAIDLVLMDIKMPVMNGFEASSLIKKIRPSLPIIAQTAYSTESEKRKALA